MKKIITTVGTSLFTNAINSNVHIDENYNEIKDRGIDEWDYYQNNRLKELKEDVIKSDFFKNQKASAEIQSILKIVEEIKENVTVYLIATATISSRLAAEIIKEFNFLEHQSNYTIEVSFNPKTDVILGLQVKDRKKFEREGLVNLLNRIFFISEGYWENIRFNITGGYKALIPYMTILSQINQVSSYYIFEDSADTDFSLELMEIPQLPLKLDEAIFEKYFEEFYILDKSNIVDFASLKYEFIRDANSCLEVVDQKLVSLNSLGIMLFEKYKAEIFLFYTPDEVWEEIQRQKDILRIIRSKFYDKQERVHKNKTEQSHKTMFKDGNNSNRIYYFEMNEKIYIYKTFEDHSLHERFIKIQFDEDYKNNIIQNSKLRKIRKES